MGQPPWRPTTHGATVSRAQLHHASDTPFPAIFWKPSKLLQGTILPKSKDTKSAWLATTRNHSVPKAIPAPTQHQQRAVQGSDIIDPPPETEIGTPQHTQAPENVCTSGKSRGHEPWLVLTVLTWQVTKASGASTLPSCPCAGLSTVPRPAWGGAKSGSFVLPPPSPLGQGPRQHGLEATRASSRAGVSPFQAWACPWGRIQAGMLQEGDSTKAPSRSRE